ncbi:MAG TPA: hypothetical protein VGQ91_11970 [Ideonella sp.]|jgi:hypothetical protein|nr:hypothetical protein [Ideonella sp.]
MRRFELVIHRQPGTGASRGAQALAILLTVIAVLAVVVMLLLGYALLGVVLVVALAGLAVAMVGAVVRALWRRATRR